MKPAVGDQTAGFPAAVLWDMDGTLVDTEPYWMEAERDLVAQHGGTWTLEDALALVGSDLLEAGRYIREHGGVDLSPREVVDALHDRVVVKLENEVPWVPGARELLLALKDAGVPVGLVTMSWKVFVAPVLAALPQDVFDTVVTGDVVPRGKPHPDPYEIAARNLGVAPERCVAIEDSPTGAASAHAAGCAVLVVPNHVSVPEGPRRVFVPTLADLTPEGLAEVLATGRREHRL